MEAVQRRGSRPCSVCPCPCSLGCVVRAGCPTPCSGRTSVDAVFLASLGRMNRFNLNCNFPCFLFYHGTHGLMVSWLAGTRCRRSVAGTGGQWCSRGLVTAQPLQHCSRPASIATASRSLTTPANQTGASPSLCQPLVRHRHPRALLVLRVDNLEADNRRGVCTPVVPPHVMSCHVMYASAGCSHKLRCSPFIISVCGGGAQSNRPAAKTYTALSTTAMPPPSPTSWLPSTTLPAHWHLWDVDADADANVDVDTHVDGCW